MQTVYTIGYQGVTPAALLDAVERVNAVLVDVRYRAASRQPEWRQPGLRRLLRERYMHVPEFGNANYKGDGPIVLSRPHEGLARVRPILAERPIVLMCACWSFMLCHRTKVAEFIQREMGNPFTHWTASELKAAARPVAPDQLPLF